MSLTVSMEEFEVSEEQKISEIQYEVRETVKRIEFLDDRYRQRVKLVERKRRDLIRTARIFGGLASGMFLLAILLLVFAQDSDDKLATVIIAVDFLTIFGILFVIIMFVNLRTYQVHSKTSKKVYTLSMEERDLLHYMETLAEIKRKLELFMEQGEIDEKSARMLLEEAEPLLIETERQADFSYGNWLYRR